MMTAEACRAGEETDEETDVDNPFRDAGPVDRAMPWLSGAFVVLVLVGALAPGVPSVIGLANTVLAAVLVGRFSYVVIRRDRVRRRNRLGR
ncbi:hypothetical protein AB0M32_47480 [Streptomyces sp. NPDC051985]|uniref:hypothetical protein n=1 Tax=Streptomyces sp. NPDC051985 TaxID=3155807 RepID=UPI003433CE26